MALTGAYWVLRSGRHSIKGTEKALSCIPSCSDCWNSSSESHWQISGGPRRATECWVYLCVHVSVSFIQQCRVWEVPREKALDPQELRTQLQNTKNRASRQAQCINSTCSGHFISGELPEAKHWLSSVFERPKNACLYLGEGGTQPHCKILGIMSFAYGNHYCTINFTLKPYFCSRWHFIFSKRKVERTRMS